MIGSIESKVNNQDISNLPSYMYYSIEFLDGDILELNLLLRAGTTETIKVRIEFKEDINEDDLLDTQDTLNFSLQINYTQARSNAIDRMASYNLFTNNKTNVYLGTSSNELGTTYNTYQEVVNTRGYPFFLRHTLKQHSDKVYETSVGYVLDGNDYYIKGRVDEHGLATKPVYEANKSILLISFGNANCEEVTFDEEKQIACIKSGLTAFADTYGNVAVTDDAWYCYIHNLVFSTCDDGK